MSHPATANLHAAATSYLKGVPGVTPENIHEVVAAHVKGKQLKNRKYPSPSQWLNSTVGVADIRNAAKSARALLQSGGFHVSRTADHGKDGGASFYFSKFSRSALERGAGFAHNMLFAQSKPANKSAQNYTRTKKGKLVHKTAAGNKVYKKSKTDLIANAGTWHPKKK